MFWQFLNHWWNLPSLVLLGLVGVYFVLQAIGLAGHAGGGDTDVDHELEHDLDAGGAPDGPGEHEVEHDHEAGAEHDAVGEGGSALGVLAAFLGLGRVPFKVVWLTLFTFTGFTGLFANKVVWDVLGHVYPGWSFGVSLVLSLAVGVAATRLSSGLVSRFVDVGGQGASRKQDLAGQLGVVASPHLDDTFGEVRVKDARGDELLVHARVHAGDPALPKGTRVVLTEYDEGRGLFTAAALGQDASPPGETEGSRPVQPGALRNKIR